MISPWSVNLMALPTRLSSTWVRRRSSPRPAGRSVGISTLKASFLLAASGLDRAIDAVHDVLERIIVERQHELAGLDLGQVEHVVDQAEQVLAVARDALEHGHHLLRRLAIDAVLDQLGVAQDGVERRAQLVAHVGEELRLVLARLGELAALLLDFVEQPHVLDGDRGLVGEGGHQLDLLVGERPDVGSRSMSARRPASPSRSIGTPSMVRKPPSFCASGQVYSGSVCTSGIWTTLPSSSARPVPVSRAASTGRSLTYSMKASRIAEVPPSGRTGRLCAA